MNRSAARLVDAFRAGLSAILVAAALVPLYPIQPVHGHQQSAPWLDESVLDGGLYVELRHPQVIRRAKPFHVSVVMINLRADTDVTVEEVRYLVPGASAPVVHRRDELLVNKSSAYEQYKESRQRLENIDSDQDATGVGELYARSRLALMDVASGALRDRQRIDGDLIPPAGSTLEVMVEVDVSRGGQRRTLRRAARIPVQPPLPAGAGGSWFAGDQHLHTAFSIDAFLFDGTRELISDYAAAAETIGLDWIIVTDHTNIGFSIWYDPSLFAIGEILARRYRSSQNFLVLQGQEMGAGAIGALGEPAHLLAYPRFADSTGFLPNPCSGLVFNHVNCEPEQVIVDRVNDAGGIGFIAHPFDSAPLAFAPWDIDAGIVGWGGLEIFNSSAGVFGTEDQESVDWWHDLLGEVDAPFNGELADRPDYPTRFPVGLGNSDAHQPGEIGNTFSYAFLPGVTRGQGSPSREDVADAFVSGRLVASNGPLVFGQVNGAGTGEVAAVSFGENRLRVTLLTTPEFGPVGDYEITVLVDGAPRVTVPPSGAMNFFKTVVFDDLLAPPDKFVTIRARRSVCDGCPPDAVVYQAITNPIWIEFIP
jgi:hypothetical protein